MASRCRCAVTLPSLGSGLCFKYAVSLQMSSRTLCWGKAGVVARDGHREPNLADTPPVCKFVDNSIILRYFDFWYQQREFFVPRQKLQTRCGAEELSLRNPVRVVCLNTQIQTMQQQQYFHRELSFTWQCSPSSLSNLFGENSPVKHTKLVRFPPRSAWEQRSGWVSPRASPTNGLLPPPNSVLPAASHGPAAHCMMLATSCLCSSTLRRTPLTQHLPEIHCSMYGFHASLRNISSLPSTTRQRCLQIKNQHGHAYSPEEIAARCLNYTRRCRHR